MNIYILHCFSRSESAKYSMFLHSKKGYKNSYIKDRKSFDCYSHWLATVIKYKLKTALTRQRLLADSYESEAPSSQVSAKAEEHSNTIRVVKSADVLVADASVDQVEKHNDTVPLV